jgi:hypothetical protein
MVPPFPSPSTSSRFQRQLEGLQGAGTYQRDHLLTIVQQEPLVFDWPQLRAFHIPPGPGHLVPSQLRGDGGLRARIDRLEIPRGYFLQVIHVPLPGSSHQRRRYACARNISLTFTIWGRGARRAMSFELPNVLKCNPGTTSVVFTCSNGQIGGISSPISRNETHPRARC